MANSEFTTRLIEFVAGRKPMAGFGNVDQSHIVTCEGGIVRPRVWYCRWCYASWENAVKETADVHKPDCLRRQAIEFLERQESGQ